MKSILLILILVLSSTLFAFDDFVDEIRVYKSQHRMDLLAHGRVVKTYRVMLGRGGPAPKVREGDNRVPEGQYVLDYKVLNSQFHKSIHISYPNEDDLRRAAELGVEPGGNIMIHGYPNRPKPLFQFLKKMGLIKLVNWTAGCVAVDDEEMDEIFAGVEVGTVVRIFR